MTSHAIPMPAAKRALPSRSWIPVTLVAFAAGCSLFSGGDVALPEEQQFVLSCQAKEQGAPKVDSSFTALHWGGAKDLRERGDTVAWAEVPDEEDEEGEESSGNLIEDLITDLAGDATSEALGFRKDTMPMILVPGGASALRRDLGARLAGEGYRLADFAMVGEDPATLRAELRRAEVVVVKHGKPFGKDEVLASVVVELALVGADSTEQWRRRFEAENLERRSWQSDAEDYQEVLGGVWCDLLEQAEEAFAEGDFGAAVRSEK